MALAMPAFVTGSGGGGATYSQSFNPGMTDYYDQNGLIKTMIRTTLGPGLQSLENSWDVLAIRGYKFECP